LESAAIPSAFKEAPKTFSEAVKAVPAATSVTGSVASAVTSSLTAPVAAPISAPVAALPPSMIASVTGAGDDLEAAQVDAIKAAILAQEKFLGQLVESASRWEMSGGELRLFFPPESRSLAEMLQARDPLERLRNISSRILGQSVRVCVKLDGVSGLGAAARSSGTHELRAKFEQDPIVRAMLERFGGQISDVKRRGED